MPWYALLTLLVMIFGFPVFILLTGVWELYSNCRQPTQPIASIPVVVPVVECKHEWVVARCTDKEFVHADKVMAHHRYVISFKELSGYPADKNQDLVSYLEPKKSGYSWYESIPVDKYYQDAVCRLCDETDLGFTKMLPVIKARQERDKALLASLKETIAQVGPK